MTKQEIFNKVYAHLVKQGRRSMYYLPSKGEEGCAYRGQDGAMCAVGCLIPDEFYTPEIENEIVSSWIVSEVLAKAGVTNGHGYDRDKFNLLCELQNAHDTCQFSNREEFILEIKARLGRIARGYQLTIPT